MLGNQKNIQMVKIYYLIRMHLVHKHCETVAAYQEATEALSRQEREMCRPSHFTLSQHICQDSLLLKAQTRIICMTL